MGNDAICLEKQGECGAMADAMPVASVAGGDSLIDGLSDKVDMLESKVNQLGDKFDVWQRLVESILGTAQTAMQYDSNLIAFLAIGVGVFSVAVGAIVTIAIAVINHIANKNKREAMDKAIEEINKTIKKTTSPIEADSSTDNAGIDKTGKTELDLKNLGRDSN